MSNPHILIHLTEYSHVLAVSDLSASPNHRYHHHHHHNSLGIDSDNDDAVKWSIYRHLPHWYGNKNEELSSFSIILLINNIWKLGTIQTNVMEYNIFFNDFLFMIFHVTAAKYFYITEEKVFFQFKSIMNVLVTSFRFICLCFGSTGIINILSLSVLGSTLDVRIWRL